MTSAGITGAVEVVGRRKQGTGAGSAPPVVPPKSAAVAATAVPAAKPAPVANSLGAAKVAVLQDVPLTAASAASVPVPKAPEAAASAPAPLAARDIKVYRRPPVAVLQDSNWDWLATVIYTIYYHVVRLLTFGDNSRRLEEVIQHLQRGSVNFATVDWVDQFTFIDQQQDIIAHFAGPHRDLFLAMLEFVRKKGFEGGMQVGLERSELKREIQILMDIMAQALGIRIEDLEGRNPVGETTGELRVARAVRDGFAVLEASGMNAVEQRRWMNELVYRTILLMKDGTKEDGQRLMMPSAKDLAQELRESLSMKNSDLLDAVRNKDIAFKSMMGDKPAREFAAELESSASQTA